MPKYFTGVWTPQVTRSTPNRWVNCLPNDTLQIAFDVYVLGLLLWNAMDRPRLPNDKLLRMLYEDGVFLIIVSLQYPTSMTGLSNETLLIIISAGMLGYDESEAYFRGIRTLISSDAGLRVFNLAMCSFGNVGGFSSFIISSSVSHPNFSSAMLPQPILSTIGMPYVLKCLYIPRLEFACFFLIDVSHCLGSSSLWSPPSTRACFFGSFAPRMPPAVEQRPTGLRGGIPRRLPSHRNLGLQTRTSIRSQRTTSWG